MSLRSTGFALAALAAFGSSALAQLPACPEGESLYTQDIDNALGWNQMLPIEEADAGLVRFHGLMEMDVTMNGETIEYRTIGGGTGIRSRVAIRKDGADGDKWYAFYDLGSRVTEGQPDYFLIVDGDMFWPACEL